MITKKCTQCGEIYYQAEFLDESVVRTALKTHQCTKSRLFVLTHGQEVLGIYKRQIVAKMNAKIRAKKKLNWIKATDHFIFASDGDELIPWRSYRITKCNGPQLKCYDCGSVIPGHHTELCDMADPMDIRDLPSKEGSQHWTGEVIV